MRSRWIWHFGAWLFVLVLLFWYFWWLWPFWLFVTLSSLIRIPQEIGNNRGSWTWLPPWMWKKEKDLQANMAHIAAFLTREFALWAGIFLAGDIRLYAVLFLVRYAWDGYTFNQGYHIWCMKPEYREYLKAYTEMYMGIWQAIQIVFYFIINKVRFGGNGNPK